MKPIYCYEFTYINNAMIGPCKMLAIDYSNLNLKDLYGIRGVYINYYLYKDYCTKLDIDLYNLNISHANEGAIISSVSKMNFKKTLSFYETLVNENLFEFKKDSTYTRYDELLIQCLHLIVAKWDDWN
jgi:hypothetical protein